MSKAMKRRVLRVGVAGMALFAGAVMCFLLLSQGPKAYSGVDVAVDVDQTWSGDHEVNGTLTIAAGITLTIDSSASAPVTLKATNLIVQSGAKISANGKGLAGGAATADGAGTGKGLAGSASKSGGGAGYGGAGGSGAGNASSGGVAYGDNSIPVLNGSGGGGGASDVGGAGGGAIRIVVTGTTTLTGAITANGANGTGATNGSGAGSGGSVFLDTNVLTGDGSISANGGSAEAGSGGKGGGGRVAIYANDKSGFSGTVSVAAGTTGSGSPADGSSSPSGAIYTGGISGTGPMALGYYYATYDLVWTNAGGNGLWSNPLNWSTNTVPVATDNAIFNATSTTNCAVDVAGTVTVKNFTLQDGYGPGIVTLGASTDLTVTGAGATDGTVTLNDGKFVDSARTVRFKNLSIAYEADRVTSTGTWRQTASGNVINSNYTTNPLAHYILEDNVTATVTGNTWCRKLTLEGANSNTAAPGYLYVYAAADNVVTQAAGSYIAKIFLYPSGTRSQGALNVGDLQFYVNDTSTTVNMGGDWNVQGVCSVGVNNYPMTLNTGIYSLNVAGDFAVGGTGYDKADVINFGSGAHTFGGNFKRYGATSTGATLNFNSATLNFNSNSARTISYIGLTAVNPGTSTINLQGTGAVTLEAATVGANINKVSVNNLACAVPNKTVKVEAGKTLSVGGNLTLTGNSSNKVFLRSTVDASTYNVAVAGLPNANYVDVKDSIATPKAVVAYNATLSNTTGWLSAVPGDVYWTNASGDGNWNTAANWSTGAVPISTDSVYFAASSTSNCAVNVTGGVTVANLTLATGYTGTVTLSATSGDDLTVTNTITINAGKLVDSGRTVNFKNVYIADGCSYLTSTGTWKATATGTASNRAVSCGVWGHAFSVYEVAPNVTVNQTHTVACKKLILGDGSTLTGSAPYVAVYGNNPVTQGTGAVINTSNFYILALTDFSQGKLATMGAVDIRSGVTSTMTMTGDLSAGSDLYLMNSTPATNMTLAMGANKLSARDVLMGWGAGSYGTIDFGTATGHTVRNIASGQPGTGKFTAINFGSSTVNMSGNLDLRYIPTVTTGTSTLNITGTGTSILYAHMDGANINTIPLNNFTSSAANKTIQVEAGKTLVVGGRMTLAGVNLSPIQFQSTVASTAFNLTLNGYASNMDYLTVTDSVASKGISTTNSTFTRTTNWFNSASGTVVWTNAGGTGLWSTATNWSTGVKPASGDSVVFNGTSTANCTVDEAVSITNLTLDTGYSTSDAYATTGKVIVNTANADLTVSNSITLNAGLLSAGTGRTVSFKNFYITNADGTSSRYSGTISKMTSSGSISVLTDTSSTYNNHFGKLQLDPGVILTPKTERIKMKTLELGEGASIAKDGATRREIFFFSNTMSITQPHDANGSPLAILDCSIVTDGIGDPTVGPLTILGNVKLYQTTSLYKMGGNWNVGGDLKFYNYASPLATQPVFDTNGYNLTVGGNLSGQAAAPGGNYSKFLFKNGTHTISGSLGNAYGGAISHVTYDLGTSTVNVSGNIDFRYCSVIPGSSTVNITAGTGATTLYPIFDTTLKDPALDVAGILGTIPLWNLTSTAPSKTINVQPGAKLTVANNLTLNGQASGTPIIYTTSAPAWVGGSTSYSVNASVVTKDGITYQCLVSHLSGTFATDLADGKWVAIPFMSYLNVAGAATNMNYLTVSYSDASSGKSVVAYNSTNSGNTTNWIFGTPNDIFWTNAGGTGLWSTATNWSTNTVPGPSNNVYFSTTSTKNCLIDVVGTVTVNNFTINTGFATSDAYVTTGKVTIGASTDLTVIGPGATDGTIKTLDGRFYDGGRTVRFKNFDLNYVSGSTFGTGYWIQTDSGTIKGIHYDDTVNNLRIMGGVTSTITGGNIVYIKTLTMEANSTLTGGTVQIRRPAINDFIVQPHDPETGLPLATISSQMQVSYPTANLSQGVLTLGSSFVLQQTSDKIFTMTGDWHITGTLTVTGGDYSKMCTLDTNDKNLIVGGNLGLGTASTETVFDAGTVYFRSGHHEIGGNIYVVGNFRHLFHSYLYFDDSYVKVGGNIDFRYASVDPGTSTIELTGTTIANLYGIVDYALKDVALDTPFLNMVPVNNLICNVPNKTIKVEAGKTLRVGGNLTLTGQTGTDKKVLLRSTTDGTTYNVAVTGLPSANYVDVKDSIATPKEILANNSTLLNTTGWIAPAANDVYWINASGDGLWSTAANWSTGAVPGTTSNVYFSATSTSSCSFDSLAPDTAIASLTLNAGYTGTLSLTKDITVTGTITVNGGNITDNGKNVNFVNVSVGYASSRITSTSPAVWKMTGNGTAINAYHPTNAFYKFEVAAGVVCTIQEDQVAIQKQLIQRANSRIDMKVVRPTGSSPAIIVFKYGQKGASSLDNPIVQEDGASIVGTGGNNMQRIVFYDSTITNLNIRSLTFPYGYVSVDKCDTSISGTWDYTITGTNSSLFQFASIGGTLNLGSAIINVTKTSGTDGFSLFHYANGSSASTLNLGAATINASSTGSAVLSIFKTGASGGTLNPGTATINLSTSSTAGIKIGNGSNPLNLTNLNVSNSAGKTVYFNNLGYDGVTPMVYNVANLSMQGASGNNLMVRSVTDGTAYKLNVTGAATGMQYLDVKDSDSSGGNSIVAMDSISTGSNNKNWAFPGPGDHLGFASGAPAAQAGVSFNLPKLVAQDVYHNALTNYSGAKTIAYTLSGSSNSPDGNDTDSFTTAVNFTNGESTTALATTLYRAQTTTVTPSDAANLTGTNSASDVITVNPNTATKIAFKQQPSSTAVINAPFTRQPIVAIRDMYGNQTTDTFSIQLFPSATSEPPFGDAGGILTSSHVDNTLAATAGAAAFAGVNYANAGELYLYAEALGGGSELTAAFSTAVNLATAQTTVVEAAASPVANFNLTPTFDTLAEKFEVLKFKISDKGSDNIPTMIDRINVAVGGTGANASTDIAWAGLYADGVKVADASAIANDTITFGTAPNGGGAADLYDLDDNSTTEFTVYIYMKAGKLTSTEGQTYTFTTNENNIGVDTGGETSGIAANTASITTVTGTVTVLATHLGVVTAATGDTEAALTAGTPAELSVRATDANKNVDINYGGNRSLVFSGLGGVGIYNPLIEAKTFGSTTTINFTQGVSATNAVTLTAYKKEIGTVVVQENTKSYIQNGLVATVSAGAANAIAVGSGNNQSGRISWPLADTFVALVSDQYGNGVAAGTAVNFAIASQPNGASGAGLSTISGFTDSNGQVATTFTVGSAAGAYQVTAASTGLNGSPVTFTATGLSPSAIQIASGNNQSKQIAMALDNPLVVKVVDPTGIAIPNETVNFTILSYPDGATGQALSVSSATTNASGLAQVVLTLGTRTGDYKVAVSSGSLPAIELTATATPGGPYQVVLSGPGSVKAGQVSTVYTITTQDASGNSSNLSTSTVFSLTTSPVRANGVFYSNSDGTGVITSLTVTSGTSSANFYYKDTTTGTANLVATRTSGQALTVTNSSQAVTIMPADAFLYKVTGSTATIATGGTKALTITAYDNQGNVKNDYTGDMNVVFSGATASPAPAAKKATASNKTSQDIDFGQTTVLSFSSGVATTTAKFYNVEGVTVKAASGTVETATEDALSFIVKHGAANHLKFSGNLPSPQAAGTEFNFDTELNAVDLYDNLCDGANGASAFSGSPQVGWALSGTSNGPEGNVTDEFVSPVTFSGGVSSTLLKAKLYYAQNTTITASTAALTGTNVASNIITVNSGAASKLTWAPQPAAAGVTTQALTIQPKVTVSDQYGNPVSGSSAGVTLTASLTTGTFTPVVNGSLSATSGLTVATVNGVAAFAGLTYSFPETIYLRATVSGVDMTPLYSWGVNFATAPDGAFAAGAAGATQISSLAYTAADKVGVLNFKITDGGTDGFATKIKQLILKRNTADTTGGWSSFLKGAYISDGAAQFVGTIEDNQIIFGLGTDDIYSVTNGTVKNFTVSVYLKNPLPVDSDNKVLSFKLDPTTDILLGSPSSTLAAASALTASPILAVVATDFVVSGNTTMNAGDTQAITLKVTDALGNLDKDYSGEKILVFSGANVSFKGNAPIETTTQNLFGDPTPVAFTAGQSSTQVGIQLFTAETAYIKATENSAGVTTANKNALIVRVAGGTATGLSWLIQPAAAVVEEASLKEFSVVVVDAYGNTSSSSADVTVVPSSGELCAGASGTVAAQQGIATFYNFAVKNLADGEIITLSGTANGLTGTGASSEILVSKKYTVVLNVKDSVTQGGLNNVILTITNSDTGELVTIPTHSSPWTGNSPFKDNFKLPAGAYTLSLEREEYVANSKDVVAGAAQDGMDGTYDNKLTWDIYMTSIAESMADYKGIADFVYDEDTDALNITQRLERRGQQKVSDGINNLGVATIEIFDGSDKIGTLTANPDAQGNYWYAIPNVTSVAPTGNYVVGSFTKPLMNGKTYFARCLIFYGGTTGDKTSYGSGTTFTITVTQRLSKEIINSLGVYPGGETLATRLDNVKAGVTAVSSKVDTTSAAVTAKVETVGTQVSAVNANVSTTGTKIDTVQGTVGVIQTDVTKTLPAKILADMEKGVMSEMLTRNTILREDDEVKIRYRTASGLAPVLTIITPDGTALPDYNGVKMTEINKTGIYEYSVTAKEDWGIGDFTVECSEPTKGSKDSMVLTVKALYTAGAGVQESVDAVGEAVSKVYTRQKGIEGLLGTVKDPQSAKTIFAKMNTVNSKLDSYNLTGVSSDARDAKQNAENVYNEIKSLTSGMSDLKAQATAVKQLSSQLEEMRSNLAKASKSLTSAGGSGGGEVVMASGGGSTGVGGEAGSGVGLNASNERELAAFLKDAKAKKSGITESESKDLNNKIEELTALVKVLGQMVQNTNNKPIVEGWFEQG